MECKHDESRKSNLECGPEETTRVRVIVRSDSLVRLLWYRATEGETVIEDMPAGMSWTHCEAKKGESQLGVFYGREENTSQDE